MPKRTPTGFVSRYLSVNSVAALAMLVVLMLTSLAVQAQAQDDFILEPGNRSYTVRSGDTLQSIARTEFGTAGYWRHIAEHNQLAPDELLSIGQVLALPLLLKRDREFASVVFFKGDVSLKKEKSSASRPLTRSDKIVVDDIIRTGISGFASIEFLSGTVVNIQPSTSVRLARLRCLADDEDCFVTLDAERGSLSSDVKKKNEQNTRFIITTPYASAAVRGTFFDVEATPGKILIGVTDGDVDVVAQNKTSPLAVGFGAVTAAGQATGEPIELIGPPTFRGIPSRFAAGDKLSWWRVPDGSNYIVTMSDDAAGQNIISQKRQNGRVYQLAAMDPGEYFVNVRPLDSNGLKGFGTSQKVNIVAVDESIAGFPIEVLKEGSDMTVSIAEPSETVDGYEFQLSPDADFNDIVSIDVGRSGSAVFRSPDKNLYIRARALLDTARVSRFGPASKVN